MGFDKYAERLNQILAMKKAEAIAQDEEMQQGFAPEDEIAFKHNLIHPEKTRSGNFLSRDMRTANLSSMEYVISKRVFIYLTWLRSLITTRKLQDDQNMTELQDEVKEDMEGILNLSVAKKGWLVDNILNPKKKFSITTDRADSKRILQRKEKE